MSTKNSNEKPAVPNNKLRDARLQRGWSYRDIAEHIEVPDPRTVGRWERGVSFTSPHYRKKLCELFGMDNVDLGLNRPLSISAASFNKLPTTFSSFIGRKQEVDKVCTLLMHPDIHLLTLLGTGGIGKTRLGIETAIQLGDHFTNGVCFVPLATLRDPDLLMSTVATALGIRDRAPLTSEQQVKMILRDMHMLLFLDNFEHLINASSIVEELLQACPHIKILVTSRQILQLQAEHIFTIPTLSLPADKDNTPLEHLMQYTAVALFMQRAQTYQPSLKITPANAAAIIELCIRLDGLPLAIELAAARVKLFTPQALLTRITQDQHILRNDLRTIPERHHTLDYMIKWSYDLLSEQEKWFFQHFAVFIGGAQIETIEECFNAAIQPPATIVEIVTSVLNKSLIQRIEQENDEPRFSMLETLRHYALDCLQTSGEIQTQYRAYAMYYLALVERAAPYLKSSQQAQWLAKLDQEVDNLREALRWLIEQQETELALRFCEAFGKFCGLRGYWNDEKYWLQTTLLLPELPEPQQQAIRARVLRRAGHLAYRLRDLPEAYRLLQQSIDYSRKVHDWQNLAGALSSQGWVLYRQNEKMAAEKLLQECVEVAYRSADNWVLANSLESQGRFMRNQGQGEEARRLLQESIAIARKHLDKESLARILTTQVTLEIAQNNLAQAMNVAQESCRLAQELGTKPLIALTLDTLGEVTLFQGNYIQAKQLFEERIVMAEELGDISTIAIRQLKSADIALALGDLDQETHMVEETLDLLREQGDKAGIDTALCLLGDIKKAAGDREQAHALYHEVLQRYKEPDDKSQVCRCLIGLAQIMLDQEKLACAAYLFGAAESCVSAFDMYPKQRTDFQQAQEKTRQQMGESIFMELWSQGRSALLADIQQKL